MWSGECGAVWCVCRGQVGDAVCVAHANTVGKVHACDDVETELSWRLGLRLALHLHGIRYSSWWWRRRRRRGSSGGRGRGRGRGGCARRACTCACACACAYACACACAGALILVHGVEDRLQHFVAAALFHHYFLKLVLA